MHKFQIQLDDRSDYSSFAHSEGLINKTKIKILISGAVSATAGLRLMDATKVAVPNAFFLKTYIFHTTYTLLTSFVLLPN